jgi:hypothetical protein
MQYQAMMDARGVSAVFQHPFHKITHEVANKQLWVVAGKMEVKEKVQIITCCQCLFLTKWSCILCQS